MPNVLRLLISRLSLTSMCFRRSARNKVTYYWRLLGMFGFILMLLVAYVPTARYIRDDDPYGSPRPAAEDDALCQLTSGEPGDTDTENIYPASQQRMVLSTGFLGKGMLNRL